jgi:aspartyl-tRNA(Asn)/glutamyl-tRNA(Gln) amidotransferase subunit C
MNIDAALLHKLGRLARLEIRPEQEDQLRSDLQKMIGFVDKLNELDTTGISPLLHLTRSEESRRADTAAAPMASRTAVSPAAKKEAPYFIVPKVIQK